MAEISHPWDTLMKLLMRKEAQALASLALPGVQVGKALDKELKVRGIEGDFFFARNRSDLLALGHNLAGLIFTNEIDKQWLKERFGKVQDILEESWVYQETIQKGLEQGLEQGFEKGREEGREEGRQQGALQAAQQMAISIVAARFPELERLARLIIAAISDLNQLQMLVVELSTSLSQEHAKQLLLSLV